VLFFLFCRRFSMDSGAALISTLAFGFATSTWALARDAFQHPLEALLLLAALYVVIRDKRRPGPSGLLQAGTLLGLGLLTRINLLLVVPSVLCYVALTRSRLPQRDRWSLAHDALALLAPVGLFFCAALWVNYAKFDDPFLFNAPAQRHGLSTPIWVGLYGFLFSAGRSVFLYSPPMLLGLVMYREFFRRHRSEAILFAAVTLTYLVVFSSYGAWHGDWAWGPRFLLPITALVVLPLGYLVGSASGRIAVTIATFLGVVVQLLGVSINYDFVYWDWIRMGLQPQDAFLYVPEISPIATHAANLLQGRHVDWWLGEVYHNFGPGVLAASAVVPGLLLLGALMLLRGLSDWDWLAEA
jgi:4-amino-4-deoxy-L-arabinose transferase-like glycosyltransferase